MIRTLKGEYMKTQKNTARWSTNMLYLLVLVALVITVLSGVMFGTALGASVGGLLAGIILFFTTERIATVGFWICLLAIATTSVIMGSNLISLGWALGFVVSAGLFAFASFVNRKRKRA